MWALGLGVEALGSEGEGGQGVLFHEDANARAFKFVCVCVCVVWGGT